MSLEDTMETDVRYLKLAISLGYRSLGQTWPNPPVGCVLVKRNRIVGTGYTGLKGRPHAETNALKEAGKLANGATAFVTLEPCSHYGQTPPCAWELIKANVKRVVCPLEDPNPRVSGNGFKLLKEHGIIVDKVPFLIKEARELAEGFLKVMHEKRPFIALKLALSLNSKIATGSNESNWITGENARTLVHFFRSRYDAVMVGTNTAMIDNPELNLRGQFKYLPQPKKIILDRNLSLPNTHNFAKSTGSENLIIVHDEKNKPKALQKWGKNGIQTLGVLSNKNEGINLKDLLTRLANLGLTRVLVEGGGNLSTSLLHHNLVDLLILFTAGIIIEEKGINGFTPKILSNVSLLKSPRFKLDKTFKVGEDVAHFWRPLNP